MAVGLFRPHPAATLDGSKNVKRTRNLGGRGWGCLCWGQRREEIEIIAPLYTRPTCIFLLLSFWLVSDTTMTRCELYDLSPCLLTWFRQWLTSATPPRDRTRPLFYIEMLHFAAWLNLWVICNMAHCRFAWFIKFVLFVLCPGLEICPYMRCTFVVVVVVVIVVGKVTASAAWQCRLGSPYDDKRSRPVAWRWQPYIVRKGLLILYDKWR